MRFFVPVLLLALATSLALALPHRHRAGSRHHSRRAAPQAASQSSPSKCASQCSGVSNKFSYEIGKSHGYTYETSTTVETSGSGASTVTQKAKVFISAVSSCEFSLKVEEISLEGSESEPGWAEDLKKHSLRFSFDDGLIDNICPSPEEKVEALNIKRGILSAFQNSLEGSRPEDEVHENDVSGDCPTSYSREGNTISKTKNLIECVNHHGNYSALRGVNYQVKSELQNVPLIDSTQECSQEIQKNMLKVSTCTETHAFQPFKRSTTSITAKTTSKLQYKGSKGGAIESEVGERASLQFDHSEYQFEESSSATAAARDSLNTLCKTSADDVRPETPGTFTELVYNMRRMNVADLKKMSEEAQTKAKCPRERDFFFDAVPMCATGPCMEVLVQILRTGSLSQEEQTTWLMSLALVPRPTKAMVAAVTQLVDTMPNQALLGVSSLVHGYCKQNPSCAGEDEVEQFVNKLTGIVGENCQVKDNNEQRMLLALKALGNVGHVRSTVPRLVKCFQSDSNSLSIRISAIQALRRMPCSDDLRNPLKALLMDVNENVEARLTAFMGLMKCPDRKTLDEIVKFLDDEPITQVTSYVYSYLKAKRASNDPANEDLRALLRRHSLHRRFARDPIRYSNFYEFGHFLDGYNAGAQFEEGTIFVPGSSLPRQSFANLTLQLFGTSVNLVEVGGRFEGLDHLFNSLFGPQGYLSNPNKYLLGEKPAESKNSRVKKFQDLWSKHQPATNEVNLNVYMKMFGDELATYNYRDSQVIETMKGYMDFGRLMNAMKNFKSFELNKNVLFLDSVLTVPTVSGIPLRLAVNGTASVNVGIKANFDLDKVMTPPHSMEIMGHVMPSAAVQIAGLMALDIGGFKTGVRMTTRAHTSTNVKTIVSMKNGEEFTFTTELPQQKMTILDVESMVYRLKNNRGLDTEAFASNVKSSCTPSELNKITGLKMCAEMTLPKNGRNKVPMIAGSKLTIEKDDATLKSYEFKNSIKMTPEQKMASFSFNTPGSTVDREVCLELSVGNQMKAELRYPGKEIVAEGSLERNGGTSTGTVKLTVDKKTEYSMDATLKQPSNGKMEIEGSVERPGKPAVTLNGQMEFPAAGSNRYAYSYKLENLYAQPVEVKGSYDATINGAKGWKSNSEFLVKCPTIDVDAKYESDVKNTGDVTNQVNKFSLTHKRPSDAKAHVMKQESKFNINRQSPIQVELLSNLESNWYPQIDHKLSYNYKNGAKTIENRLNAEWGKSKQNFKIDQVTRIEKNDKYTTEVKCVSKPFRMDHSAVIVYQNRFPQLFISQVTVNTPDVKNVKANIRLDSDKSAKLQMNAEASLEYPGRKIELTHKLKEKAKDEYKSEAMINLGNNQKVEVNSDLTWKNQGAGNYEYELESVGVVNGNQAEKIQMHKRFKNGQKESRYMGYLKQGDESIYDFKLDLVRESKAKSVMHSHIKSNYLNNLDYQVNGEIHGHKKASKGHLVLKRNQKEFLKGEVTIPNKMGYDDEKHLSGKLSWDMESGKPKSISGEYKFENADNKRTHTYTSAVNMGPKSQYDMNIRVHKSDHYAVNATMNQNNAQIMDFSVGIVKGKDMVFDVELMTKAPFPSTHRSALVALKSGDNGGWQTTGDFECQISKNKMSFDAKYDQVNDKDVKYALHLKANDMYLKFDEEASFRNKYNLNSLRSTKWNLEGQVEKGKKMTETGELQLGWPIKLSIKTNSPYATMKNSELLIEMKGAGKNKAHLYEMKWNDNQKVSVRVTGGRQGRNGDYDIVLETGFDALQKLESKFNYKLQKDYDVNAEFNWDNNQKIRVYHKQSALSFLSGFETKVGSTANEAKMESTMNANGLYKADYMYKVNGKLYELDADVNTKEKKGSIEVKTPNKSYKSAKLTISKDGENGWKIETDANGEAQIVVSSEVKMEEGDHAIKFQVTKIASPFSVSYEGKYSDDKWRFKVEAIRDPENADGKKVYGVHVDDALSSGDNQRDIELRIRGPSRQTSFKVHRKSELPNKYTASVQLTPNMADNRDPTKLEFKYNKKNAKECQAELVLSDPSLPKGIKALGKMSQEGACADASSDCDTIGELRVDYSGKKEKQLVIKVRSNTEVLEQKRTVAGKKMNNQVTRNNVEFTMEHPASDLHTKVWGLRVAENCMNSVCRSELESGVEFKDAKKEVKQFSVSGEYNSFLPKISMKVNTPENNFAVSGVQKNGESQLIVSQDGEPQYMASVRYSRRKPLAQFEVKSMQGKKPVLFHGSARLVNKHKAQIKLWHTENGKRLDDGEIIVKLDKRELLNTKFFLRPDLNSQVQNARSKIEKLEAPSAGNLGQYWTAVRDSHRAFHQDVYGQTRPLFEHWSKHHQSLSSEMGPMMSALMESIELYSVLMKEVVLAAVDIVEQSFDEMFQSLPSQSFTDGYFALKESLRTLPETAQQLVKPYNDAVRSLAELMASISKQMDEIRQAAVEKLNSSQIKAAFDKIYEEAQQYPVIRELIKLILAIRDNAQSANFDGVRKAVKDYYKQAEASVGEATKDVADYWIEWEDTIMEWELGQALAAYFRESWESLRFTMKYISPEERIDDVFKYISELFREYREDALGYQRYLPKFIKSQPKKGIYEIQFRLPVKANSLQHATRVFHPDTFDTVKAEVTDRYQAVADVLSGYIGSIPSAPNADAADEKLQNVLHTIQGYSPARFETEWPVRSTALLVGDEHFITFDGKVFSFKAHCEYLLARDFANQEFTISAQFGKQGGQVHLQSVKLETQQQEIELQRRGQVKVNGKAKELPWQKVDELDGRVLLQVIRWDHSAAIKTNDGIEIDCDWYYHKCRISLPGHYHGKSAGLLGSNDNEVFNDYIQPDGEQAADLDSFAKSWHIGGGNCNAQKNQANQNRHADHEECGRYFANSRRSPFAACYRHVNPRPFLSMCEQGAALPAVDTNQLVCNVSAAYLTMCRLSGIELQMPEFCLQCQTPAKTLNNEEDVRLDGNAPQAADVVFVVEESEATEWVQGKLAEFGQQIAGAIGKKGVKDVRFGVLGFGGEGVHNRPHFHTGNNQINFDQQGLTKAAASLSFKVQVESLITPETVDPMVPMKFVAEYYPFRPAVRKIVVLIATADCNSKEVGYYALQNLLLNNGIQFNMITDSEVELQSGSAANILGMDANSLFGANGQAAGAERSQIVNPHDSCTILAQETNGAVFSSSSKAPAALKALATVIGQKTESEAGCQICECTEVCEISQTPLTRCFPCEIPQPISLTTDASSFLNIPYLKLKAPAATPLRRHRRRFH